MLIKKKGKKRKITSVWNTSAPAALYQKGCQDPLTERGAQTTRVTAVLEPQNSPGFQNLSTALGISATSKILESCSDSMLAAYLGRALKVLSNESLRHSC